MLFLHTESGIVFMMCEYDDTTFVKWMIVDLFFKLKPFLFFYMEILCSLGPLVYILFGPDNNLNNSSLIDFKKKIHGQVTASKNANLTKQTLVPHNRKSSCHLQGFIRHPFFVKY